MKKCIMAVAVAFFTLAAGAREITALTVSPSGESLVANVAFTAGETGDGHVLYIAYGAQDFGSSLSAWAAGGGVMDAVSVADDATEASVTLSGNAMYAKSFRAFLATRSAIDCDAFAEYLLSDGSSYVATDLHHLNGYVYSVDFYVDEFANSSRLLGTGYSKGLSFFEIYVVDLEKNDYQPYFIAATDGDSSIQYNSTAYKVKGVAGERCMLTFDSATATMSAVYDSSSTSYKFSAAGQSDTADTAYTWIFRSRRQTSAATSGLEYRMPSGSRFYSLAVDDADGKAVKYYIPAIKNGAMGIWDAVGNKFMSDGVAFCTTNESGTAFSSIALSEPEAIPSAYLSKYVTVVATGAAAERPARGITKLKMSGGGDSAVTATVTLSPGLPGDEDVLYIAWGASDLGGTLADWGENVYCAGAVAAATTQVAVELPAGTYPRCFRAFLARPDIACDSLAEYLLSDGTSLVRSDWYPARGDKFAIRFSTGAATSGQRLFGAWNGENSTSTVTDYSVVEVYINNPTSGKATYRHAISTSSAGVDFQGSSTLATEWHVDEPTELYYDTSYYDTNYNGNRSKMVVSYPGLNETYASDNWFRNTKTKTSPHPLDIFATRRNESTNRMPSGSKFEYLIVSNMVDSAATLARFYLPAVKNDEPGVWDAVNNVFIVSGVDGSNMFCTTNSAGVALSDAPVSFLDAVADETLRVKNLSVVSTASAKLNAGLIVVIK